MNFNEQQYERHMQLYNIFGGDENKYNPVFKPNKPWTDEELGKVRTSS